MRERERERRERERREGEGDREERGCRKHTFSDLAFFKFFAKLFTQQLSKTIQ